MTKAVHVAVGIVFNDQQQVLIAFRSKDKHQGGLWEFPGGKVEADESVEQALERELAEEINLQISALRPLLKIDHDYGDKQVCLDVWQVLEFSGDARGMEGQAINWVSLEELNDYEFPAANRAIVDCLREQF
ncbi:MAG: 8-oxo-dGTP diphosphatase MutT [Gammaproteobacteria bacterium]|nr:8-oxo-dGTP diphosphatase MutT [Gammaproteobacteria bacterium]|tara:strand:- start:1794 stop:2189 length:396 start_codon:yes stop_codon:yes gene_type:complete